MKSICGKRQLRLSELLGEINFRDQNWTVHCECSQNLLSPEKYFVKTTYNVKFTCGKNFVKATLLRKKLLKRWFDEIFSQWTKFFILPHCVIYPRKKFHMSIFCPFAWFQYMWEFWSKDEVMNHRNSTRKRLNMNFRLTVFFSKLVLHWSFAELG